MLKFEIITTRNIIDLIVKDKRYLSVCKGVAKKPHLTDDLYQEFILALLEINDNRLVEANNGKFLEVFCVGVINNIWINKDRVKSYESGKTSPFFEYCNTIELDESLHFESNVTEYNYTYEYVKKVVDKEVDSSNKDTMYKARVFNYSYFEYKNPKKFSEHSKIPYQAVIKTCQQYKEKLKQMFKKEYYD
jgi:DNA-directed RNA polymerase specialized sigma24 family protein